jgi:hypothetical protein
LSERKTFRAGSAVHEELGISNLLAISIPFCDQW